MNRRPANASRNAPENALPSAPANARVGKLPLSGSEDTYTDLTYGTRRGKGNNNCYGYAIDHYRNAGNDKLQPGNLAASPGNVDLRSCDTLTGRTLADLRGRAYRVEAEAPCRRGYYKIMGFLAPDTDYHWYKQNKDALVRMGGRLRDLASLSRALGVSPKQLVSPSPAPRAGDVVLVKDAGLWSHKQGFATGPLLKDACGKAISDPRKACRDYGKLNYTQYCGALCVKKR